MTGLDWIGWMDISQTTIAARAHRAVLIKYFNTSTDHDHPHDDDDDGEHQ